MSVYRQKTTSNMRTHISVSRFLAISHLVNSQLRKKQQILRNSPEEYKVRPMQAKPAFYLLPALAETKQKETGNKETSATE